MKTDIDLLFLDFMDANSNLCATYRRLHIEIISSPLKSIVKGQLISVGVMIPF